MRDEELQLTTREARKTLSAAVESASAVLDQLTLETYKEQMASLDAAIAMGKEALEAASALRLQYTGMMPRCRARTEVIPIMWAHRSLMKVRSFDNRTF